MITPLAPTIATDAPTPSASSAPAGFANVLARALSAVVPDAPGTMVEAAPSVAAPTGPGASAAAPEEVGADPSAPGAAADALPELAGDLAADDAAETDDDAAELGIRPEGDPPADPPIRVADLTVSVVPAPPASSAGGRPIPVEGRPTGAHAHGAGAAPDPIAPATPSAVVAAASPFGIAAAPSPTAGTQPTVGGSPAPRRAPAPLPARNRDAPSTATMRPTGIEASEPAPAEPPELAAAVPPSPPAHDPVQAVPSIEGRPTAAADAVAAATGAATDVAARAAATRHADAPTAPLTLATAPIGQRSSATATGSSRELDPGERDGVAPPASAAPSTASGPSPTPMAALPPPSLATARTPTTDATTGSTASSDAVRYLRELGPARAVQRLAVDLDGSTVSVRIDSGATVPAVRVQVLDDPSGRLGSAWTSGVERTLAHVVANQEPRFGGQPTHDQRRQPPPAPHDDVPSDRAARRWALAIDEGGNGHG